MEEAQVTHIAQEQMTNMIHHFFIEGIEVGSSSWSSLTRNLSTSSVFSVDRGVAELFAISASRTAAFSASDGVSMVVVAGEEGSLISGCAIEEGGRRRRGRPRLGGGGGPSCGYKGGLNVMTKTFGRVSILIPYDYKVCSFRMTTWDKTLLGNGM